MTPPATLLLHRRHYQDRQLALAPDQLAAVERTEASHVGVIELPRRRSLAFWATLGIFLLMMFLIGTTALHNALAALLGASLLLATTKLTRNTINFFFKSYQRQNLLDLIILFLTSSNFACLKRKSSALPVDVKRRYNRNCCTAAPDITLI